MTGGSGLPRPCPRREGTGLIQVHTVKMKDTFLI